jgi:IS5 family transposase
MGPKPVEARTDHDLFRTELVKLIDWQAFVDKWSLQFVSTTGRPVLLTRLMAALLYLKHAFALSDEDVVERWCENPYRQHFSGERYFGHKLPCDPSSLVRRRRRIGEEGCEWLLAQSIEAAKNAGVIKRRSLDAVVLDTTVQQKAIAHPTDSRLLNRAREQLVEAALGAGCAAPKLRARGKAADLQAGRYAHAKQYKRMPREIRKLRTWLGRVTRDVQRKGSEIDGALKQKLEIAQRLHAQKRDSKNKLYALHTPEVECLAKGKARTPYEFGVKVSVAVTAKEGLVVGTRSMPGNPYDGHTVDSQIEQVGLLPDRRPGSSWPTAAIEVSNRQRERGC